MRTKCDRARISREKHEVAYCRRLAREFINTVKQHSDYTKQTYASQIRIAKALLKFTKGYTKWKK